MADGTPARPAAVSGPGALSQRTDGGAGSATQPIRVPTGGAYGEAKALEDQQRAAPLAAGGGGGVPAAAGGLPPVDMFGPTARPNEPATAGLERGLSGMYNEEDPDLVLRAIYQLYPHPSIARLIKEA